ncbi:hypothetical protein HBI46_172450 [Parastagonospora nodorum]|nr:hypothetical protein HBI46_172450 [Parastagonospora nodorum]
MAAQLTESDTGMAVTAQDKITLRNAEQSPLLRLPAELRTKIYQYTLGGLEITLTRSIIAQRLCLNSRERAANDERHPFYKLPSPSATLLSCRQVNSEAKLLLFSSNHFSIESFEPFMEFLDALSPAQRNAIGTVRIVGVGLNRTLGRHDHHGYVHDSDNFDSVCKHGLPLGRLAGLKCVVWMYYDSPNIERERYPEHVVRSIVHEHGGPADVGVRYHAYC